MSQVDLIIQALAKLDVGNDTHWTSEGLPALEALKDIGCTASRAEVTSAARGFSRKTFSVLEKFIATAEPVVEPVSVEANVVKSPDDQALELAAAELELQEATTEVEAALAVFEKARSLLDLANARYDEAVRVVEREAKESYEAKQADAIAAYQRSQVELRASGIGGV